ncbi:hypothetical protein Gotur_006384, partial [Gossypium turneri]
YFNRWNRGLSYARLPNELRDIRFLLDQRSEEETELACDLDYMLWFRIHGKSYLYGEEARSRQLYMRRP